MDNPQDQMDCQTDNQDKPQQQKDRSNNSDISKKLDLTEKNLKYWQEKYTRLLEDHRKLLNANQNLEDKLIQIVETNTQRANQLEAINQQLNEQLRDAQARLTNINHQNTINHQISNHPLRPIDHFQTEQNWLATKDLQDKITAMKIDSPSYPLLNSNVPSNHSSMKQSSANFSVPPPPPVQQSIIQYQQRVIMPTFPPMAMMYTNNNNNNNQIPANPINQHQANLNQDHDTSKSTCGASSPEQKGQVMTV